jgi:putative endonuclease
MMQAYFNYIILCNDGSYDVGVTNNIDRRFAEHCAGMNLLSYTAKRRPLKLVHVEEFQWIQDAIAREKQIKGWSQGKKEALIKRDISSLNERSKCRNGSRQDRSERSQGM